MLWQAPLTLLYRNTFVSLTSSLTSGMPLTPTCPCPLYVLSLVLTVLRLWQEAPLKSLTPMTFSFLCLNHTHKTSYGLDGLVAQKDGLQVNDGLCPGAAMKGSSWGPRGEMAQGPQAKPCQLREAVQKDSFWRRGISWASPKKTSKEIFPSKGSKTDGKRVYINEISGY